ncbi:MAG: biotin/lipoyl-containing protein [Ehrlichia sp.]
MGIVDVVADDLFDRSILTIKIEVLVNLNEIVEKGACLFVVRSVEDDLLIQTIKAPQRGVIVKLFVEDNSIISVNKGTVLCRIYDCNA